MLLTRESRLSDAVFRDPSLIPVLGRFGISLGVGDATVSRICLKHGIDTAFFLAVVNAFLNEDHFSDSCESRFSTADICGYLEATDRYYSSVQLPNIERHFNSLIGMSGSGDNNLELLRKFFLEMKEEFLSAISRDSEVLFPALRKGDPISTDLSARILVEEKIADLLAFFVLHLKGSYNTNLCTAVVSAVFMLQKDVRQNNRIRRLLLAPLSYEQ